MSPKGEWYSYRNPDENELYPVYLYSATRFEPIMGLISKLSTDSVRENRLILPRLTTISPKWFITESRIPPSRALFWRDTTLHLWHAFFPQLMLMVQIQEARVVLAINAIQSSKKLSRRAAAKLYNVPETTLRDRMKGRLPRVETQANSQILIKTEEKAIVQYILYLDLQGFPPLIGDVAVMANHILASHCAGPVGKQWPYHFIQQQKELKTCFSHAYDFQRALCENPDILNAWFCLVFNMHNKYSIFNCNFYNFNETGFIMGAICPFMVVTCFNWRGKSKAI